MNERDSEIIAQSLSQHNYIETIDIDSADLIILNTCSIRAKAEQKVMSMLGYLRKAKKSRPDLKICVAGCVAQQEGEKLLERMPHVDLVVGTQHIYGIPSLLDKKSYSGERVATDLSDKYAIPRFIPDTSETHSTQNQNQQFSRFVTIMQGCNNYCTYCVVPYTRGREVSRKYSDIIDEINVLVDSGVIEITLLGQNVNSYGKTNPVTNDGSPFSFPQLIHEVSKINRLERLRFTTSNPKDLNDDLMKCFRDVPKLCPQFHLPVQSGSNRILKKMNRKYSIEKYLELVDSLRKYCPGIALTTDIIVGFPGEEKHDFDETMKLLETVRFDASFSFKYSDRPGTASLHLSDKIDEEEKSRRLAVFQKRQNEISLERNNGYIGKTVKVLVESLTAKGYQCRAATNHVVHVETSTTLVPGCFADIQIVHAGQHSLKGRPI
jgi:tRNA-2-methylthio-N6-dimethylallyladenosine synthase